jgi:hypothetical protein
MSQDIGHILSGWDHDPVRPAVRIITGEDGSPKIQMRIDLGLLQMDMSGRPDGQAPEGYESLLDYYESRAELARAAGECFTLEPEHCASLLREGLQYYHRYLAAFILERFDLVVRDTARNLRLFAFVARHAGRQNDKMEFEQYRPYVELMHSRATASLALGRGDHRGALAHIDEGIQAIRAFLAEYHQQHRETECSELQFLLDWRRDVEHSQPGGPLQRLEQQLEVSVALEDYENAARIRDQIRKLSVGTTPLGRPSA